MDDQMTWCLYDLVENGITIYVGLTCSPPRRFKEHARKYPQALGLVWLAAYQRNKAGDIKLPQRIAGPKLKRT